MANEKWRQQQAKKKQAKQRQAKKREGIKGGKSSPKGESMAPERLSKERFDKIVARVNKEFPLPEDADDMARLGRQIAIFKSLQCFEGNLGKLDLVAGLGELIEAGLI